MESIKIQNKELSDILICSSSKTLELLLNYLKRKYDLPKNLQKSVSMKLTRFFVPTFCKKWKAAFRIQDKFLHQNKSWLDSEFLITQLQAGKIKKYEKCSENKKKKN